MAMFGRSRDVDLILGLNRELLGDIITQQASFYKYKLEQTSVNMYGEASGEKFYDGPYLFNCLIDRADQDYPESELGVDFGWNVNFSFLRDDLTKANVLAEVGDIILYQESYYEIDSVVSNQYFVGKNPDYPNNENPLNPGLENFGHSVSLICQTHHVPADRVAISPYKERF